MILVSSLFAASHSPPNFPCGSQSSPGVCVRVPWATFNLLPFFCAFLWFMCRKYRLVIPRLLYMSLHYRPGGSEDPVIAFCNAPYIRRAQPCNYVVTCMHEKDHKTRQESGPAHFSMATVAVAERDDWLRLCKWK